MGELESKLQSPNRRTTKAVSNAVAENLSGHTKAEQTFYLFVLATKYYNSIDDPDFDLMDYQIAAESVALDVENGRA